MATGLDAGELWAQLEEASHKLEEAHKMAALGRLTAGVAHEINTPVGSILSNNEVILRSLEALKKFLPEGPGSERAQKIVATLANLASVDKIACERILAVVRSVKTFARVDEGDRRKIDLNELLKDTLKLASCEYRRRIELVTDFGDLPPIECHPQLLYQAFLNVVVNGAQAIEGEGKITVTTRLEDSMIHVAIADSGRGIKPENREKLFASGFTTKAVGVGTGLGLKITREIVVDVHGGTIDFESTLGAGTTFHVRLPLEAPPKNGN
jgi:two-component system NtrC family sensor kinase